MRFLLAVIDDGSGPTTSDQLDAIHAFNEHLRAKGRLVLTGSLAPEDATVLGGDDVARTNGLRGLWIIAAPDHDTAHALGRAASVACNRPVEVHPLS